MPLTTVVPFTEVTHQMALVPLVWLAVQRERRPQWWWLAGVFGVSWLADTLAHVVNPWLVSLLYPMTQAAIITILFDPRQARLYALGLGGVGILAILLKGVEGPDFWLRGAAWGLIAWLAWRHCRPRLRASLLVTFAGGLLAWIAYLLIPSWETWGAYQATRGVGIGLFCWAERG